MLLFWIAGGYLSTAMVTIELHIAAISNFTILRTDCVVVPPRNDGLDGSCEAEARGCGISSFTIVRTDCVVVPPRNDGLDGSCEAEARGCGNL